MEDNGPWIIIIILIAVGVLWIMQGGLSAITGGEPLKEPPGASQSSLQQGPGVPASPGFQPVSETRREAAEKPPEKTPEEPKRAPNVSQYQDKIYLYAASAQATNPQQEYVQLQANYSNKEPIIITGWTLTGSNRLNIPIGKGASLLFPSPTLSDSLPIALNPGDTAFIITGRSPIGESFKLNKCIGYFQQFQNFTPTLAFSCPRPIDEPGAKVLPDVCLDYLENLNYCQAPIQIPAPVAEAGCSSYIENNINYNGCFKNHRDDKDFRGREWRIYFGRDAELWKNRRETITLRDGEGKIVSQVSY